MSKYAYIKLFTGTIIISFAIAACGGLLPIPSGQQEQTEQEVNNNDTAAMTIEALQAEKMELVLQQTLDEMARQTQSAFTTALVNEGLTQTALVPTYTSTPTIVINTDTPTPVEIIPTDTPIILSSPTATATKSVCFKVLDDWCLSHSGCSTMKIYNKTTSVAKIRIHNLPQGKIDSTFSVPVGECAMMLQPGRYHYDFYYCNEQSSGWHALNDFWYITLKCP